MDNLYCDGTEKSVADCRFDGWGKSDCTENEAAGVICESPEIYQNQKNATKSPKIKIKVYIICKRQLKGNRFVFPRELNRC